jgi:uncharacterized linocin/CFP29 family protein
MNTLFRDLAPITALAWQEIEKEATRTLKTMLAARRIVDFVGPQGFATSAVGTGRTVPIAAPPHGGIEARLRQNQPLVEIRAPFELARSELEAVERARRRSPKTSPSSTAIRRPAFTAFARRGPAPRCRSTTITQPIPRRLPAPSTSFAMAGSTGPMRWR